MIKIFAWADGTWCYAEDIEEYGWMSDDYIELWITAEATYEDIDSAVEAYSYITS